MDRTSQVEIGLLYVGGWAVPGAALLCADQARLVLVLAGHGVAIFNLAAELRGRHLVVAEVVNTNDVTVVGDLRGAVCADPHHLRRRYVRGRRRRPLYF